MPHPRNFLSFLRQTLAIGLLLTPAIARDENPATYLALGDSVAFGLDPRLFTSQPKPGDFTGYPETIASVDPRFKIELNASCPGETSSSFIYGPPDNGCNGVGP